MKYLYTTLVTSNDYIAGAVALAYSHKKYNSKYPLIIMVTDNVTNLDLLIESGFEFIIVPYREFINHHDYYFTINKFYAFNFVDYDRILFIDADMIILNNFDYLLETYDYYFVAHIPYKSYHPWSKIWGGLFIIHPDPTFIERIEDTGQYYDDEHVLTEVYYNSNYFKYMHRNDEEWPLYHDNDMPHFSNNNKYWNKYHLDSCQKIEDFIKKIGSQQDIINWK